jgi:glycosyltransferase involved in cell wall biosynthesis
MNAVTHDASTELHVVSLLWGFSLGGVAKYVEELAGVGQFAPIRMTHLCIVGRKWSRDEEALGRMKAIKVDIAGRLDFSWIYRVPQILDDLRPDVVMTHGFNGHVVVAVARWFAKHRFRIVSSYHGEYHPATFARRLTAPLYNWITATFLQRIPLGIVLVSEHSRTYLLKRGVPACRMVTVHNGIQDLQVPENARLEVRQEWGINATAFVVAVASRFDPIKGLEFFLRAAKEIRSEHEDIRVVLIGSGPSEKALKTIACELGIADIALFLGFRSDVPRCLKAADVFVLPSLMEYHSIGLLEAMRAGLPIVATAVGGNTESIADEQEGLVVPAADAAALARAIRRLVRDNELRERLGTAARQRFLSEFTVDVSLKRTAKWLVECTGRAMPSEVVSNGCHR